VTRIGLVCTCSEQRVTQGDSTEKPEKGAGQTSLSEKSKKHKWQSRREKKQSCLGRVSPKKKKKAEITGRETWGKMGGKKNA